MLLGWLVYLWASGALIAFVIIFQDGVRHFLRDNDMSPTNFAIVVVGSVVMGGLWFITGPVILSGTLKEMQNTRNSKKNELVRKAVELDKLLNLSGHVA